MYKIDQATRYLLSFCFLLISIEVIDKKKKNPEESGVSASLRSKSFIHLSSSILQLPKFSLGIIAF